MWVFTQSWQVNRFKHSIAGLTHLWWITWNRVYECKLNSSTGKTRIFYQLMFDVLSSLLYLVSALQVNLKLPKLLLLVVMAKRWNYYFSWITSSFLSQVTKLNLYLFSEKSTWGFYNGSWSLSGKIQDKETRQTWQ